MMMIVTHILSSLLPQALYICIKVVVVTVGNPAQALHTGS